ncbi:hypothetical protein [Sodalis sp. RH20]|uniref:hypothetical protein n=1 Tax=unclassified Sodalis (in: enterobacteria) TaxID=2636512 RepID=UPI0039B5CDCB
MTTIIAGSGIITNPNSIKLFTPSIEMPPLLIKGNFKRSIASLVDISGAGALFNLAGTSTGNVTFDDEGVFVTKTNGLETNVLATEAISIYSVHKQGDLTYDILNAIPFNDGSQNTTGSGYGTYFLERYPRGSGDTQINGMYATGYVYWDSTPSANRTGLQNAQQNVEKGDFVFRMMVIDPVSYTATIYSGYKGVLTKDVTQIPHDLAARVRTTPLRVGYAPNSSAISGASPALRIAEFGAYNGACTDKQAAKAYTESRALQALSGITI